MKKIAERNLDRFVLRSTAMCIKSLRESDDPDSFTIGRAITIIKKKFRPKARLAVAW